MSVRTRNCPDTDAIKRFIDQSSGRHGPVCYLKARPAQALRPVLKATTLYWCWVRRLLNFSDAACRARVLRTASFVDKSDMGHSLPNGSTSPLSGIGMKAEVDAHVLLGFDPSALDRAGRAIAPGTAGPGGRRDRAPPASRPTARRGTSDGPGHRRRPVRRRPHGQRAPATAPSTRRL